MYYLTNQTMMVGNSQQCAPGAEHDTPSAGRLRDVEKREGKPQRLARFHGNAVVSGSKMGFGLAGFVGLVVGGSIVALTVWLAHVSWVIAALVGLAVLFVFYAWGAYREWDKADRRAEDADSKRRKAESDLEGARRELDAAQRAAIPAPPTVNSAEWKPVFSESGTEWRALTFGLEHRFENPGAFLAFSALRCTVTDPDGITRSATGRGRYLQYTEDFFKGAPPARPGLYRYKWEGQLSNGRWVDITSGEGVATPLPEAKADSLG
jgi:hypothetical protein